MKLDVPSVCRYICSGEDCNVAKHGLPVESKSTRVGFSLGGRGRAPAGEGLLCVWISTQPWAAHHASRNDSALMQGICRQSMGLYLDEARRKMARLNITEQIKIKFKCGQLVEWDECGIRAETVKCAVPCIECAKCIGHRLLWNRWIIGTVRGDRSQMVVGQLPWKTSEGGGGGVPLSGAECDAFCPRHCGRGVICLTDGADAYEAMADGDIVCSPSCDRKDCLKRAQAAGKTSCLGARPRTGRSRFVKNYKHLRLSHGIVTHKREEWAIVKKIRVHAPGNRAYDMQLKHGTEVADGAWAELKKSYPSQVKSSDHDRIAEYVNAWAWRARRQGQDLFSKLGKADRCGGADRAGVPPVLEEPAALSANAPEGSSPATAYTWELASRVTKGLSMKGPFKPCLYRPKSEDGPRPATQVFISSRRAFFAKGAG